MHRLRLLVSWGPALVVALVVGWVVTVVVGRVTADARALGPMVLVPVAARALEAGAVLEEGDVAWRRLPSAAVPDGRVASDGVGRTARVPLARGEVLLVAKLAPDGVRGLAALVPAGRQAVALPATTPGLRRGDRVDVLAVDGAAEAAVVAVGALVLDIADDVVTVAVAMDEAPAVAAAAVHASVVLAVVAPQP